MQPQVEIIQGNRRENKAVSAITEGDISLQRNKDKTKQSVQSQKEIIQRNIRENKAIDR